MIWLIKITGEHENEEVENFEQDGPVINISNIWK